MLIVHILKDKGEYVHTLSGEASLEEAENDVRAEERRAGEVSKARGAPDD